MLRGTEYKFCEGIVMGMNSTQAYAFAHPNVSYAVANASGYAVLRRRHIRAEIERLRTIAHDKGGSAVMTVIEKRSFLARVVRARIAELPEDSDLWQSVKHSHCGHTYRLPDKVQAIVEDNKLSGDGSEAAAYDSLTLWLGSLRG